MTNTGNKSGVFNRCALEESFLDSRISAHQADECAQQILSAIAPILESTLKCTRQDTWTLNTFWPRSGISHAADVAGLRIEIADLTPRESELPKGRHIHMERVVSIFPNGQNPEQPGTVFFYLHPHRTPELFLMTGAPREDGTFTCRQYAYKGDQRDAVKDALKKLTKTIEESIPLPPWAENFDKCYIIREGSLYARRTTLSTRNRLH